MRPRPGVPHPFPPGRDTTPSAMSRSDTATRESQQERPALAQRLVGESEPMAQCLGQTSAGLHVCMNDIEGGVLRRATTASLASLP